MRLMTSIMQRDEEGGGMMIDCSTWLLACIVNTSPAVKIEPFFFERDTPSTSSSLAISLDFHYSTIHSQ